MRSILNRSGPPDAVIAYAVRFDAPGHYRLHALGQGGHDGELIDRVAVRFGAADQIGAARPDVAGQLALPGLPAWVEGPTFAVESAGWHWLALERGEAPPRDLSRYPSWRIDQLVITPTDAAAAARDGATATLADAAVAVPTVPPSLQPVVPSHPVFAIKDGVAVIEAEQLAYRGGWELRHEPRGFTGEGYLYWTGPEHSRSVEGLGGNDDDFGIRQGPPSARLILRVHVPEAGRYQFDARNWHRLSDGDNDAWIGRPGQIIDATSPVVRIGDSLRDGTGFTWLDWGGPVFEFGAGVNEIFVGGRSIGFGLDRFVFFAADDSAARERALDPATPPTTPLPGPR